MKNQPVLHWFVPVIGILALVASAAGLFWQGGNGPFSFTTLHDRGIYRNDTL